MEEGRGSEGFFDTLAEAATVFSGMKLKIAPSAGNLRTGS